ncbi:MAG: 16S rRNA (uracil(1498)-N(3))-methyltransferase [Parvularculales bacterium]
MTVLRLFVEGGLAAGQPVALDGGQAHYLLNVMRRQRGDEVVVFNGRDGEWGGRIEQLGSRGGEICVETLLRSQETGCNVWLVFAPLKRARLDFVAQRATEMGAARLQPVLTRRTIVSRVKLDRLRANAIEAAEQCHLLSVPVVTEVLSLEYLLENWERDAPERLIMFCDEAAEKTAPVHQLREVSRKKGVQRSWAVLVGPEGGFDDEERELLRAREDVVNVSLGPRIMRADTAAVAALTLWHVALGDLS